MMNAAELVQRLEALDLDVPVQALTATAERTPRRRHRPRGSAPPTVTEADRLEALETVVETIREQLETEEPGERRLGLARLLLELRPPPPSNNVRCNARQFTRAGYPAPMVVTGPERGTTSLSIEAPCSGELLGLLVSSGWAPEECGPTHVRVDGTTSMLLEPEPDGWMEMADGRRFGALYYRVRQPQRVQLGAVVIVGWRNLTSKRAGQVVELVVAPSRRPPLIRSLHSVDPGDWPRGSTLTRADLEARAEDDTLEAFAKAASEAARETEPPRAVTKTTDGGSE